MDEGVTHTFYPGKLSPLPPSHIQIQMIRNLSTFSTLKASLINKSCYCVALSNKRKSNVSVIISRLDRLDGAHIYILFSGEANDGASDS